MAPHDRALPIDEVRNELLRALSDHRNVALIAPPGAGKTTRIPSAIVDAKLSEGGCVYVLEPRRLAARMAATHVARARGQNVGESIGYEVRFDRKISATTRIRFVTEGVLLRKLARDPRLSEARVVVIDEFHERHLAGDLALALVRGLQRSHRPDLHIAVMSATLDPGPVARFLGDCPIVTSRGRAFPVDIQYPEPGRFDGDTPLEHKVATAVRRACRELPEGDVLVFLPGAAEIRRCMSRCADFARSRELLLLPLHGDLPAAEQDRAVARQPARKVIFATNVAETSITIDGVVCVIDSGLARVARHSPWSGLPTLRVEPISRASAAQRAGRAGRTRAGICVRLYHQHDHDHRRPFDTPEIQRADLADAALLLHAWGVSQLDRFDWFESPPIAAIRAADALLLRMAAIDDSGTLTDIGREMMRFPVHPRHARLLVEAERCGVARQACTLVSLLGQRELRQHRRTDVRGGAHTATVDVVSGPSDVLEDMDAIERLGTRDRNARRARAAGLDPSVLFAVERAAKRLRRIVREAPSAKKPSTEIDEERTLLKVTLAGYPDRVAKRRHKDSTQLLLAGGGGASLSPSSVVTQAEFLLALDIQERTTGHRSSVRVHRASKIDPMWLFDAYIDQIQEQDELVWNSGTRRVEHMSRLSYDGLLIDETRDPAGWRRDPDTAAALLANAALALGIERFIDSNELNVWRARIAFAASVDDTMTETALSDEDLTVALQQACFGLSSLKELEQISLITRLVANLNRSERECLDRLAPTHVQIPGRKRVPVNYEFARSPWIASRLQDFFSLNAGPTVGGGRTPLVLHLLAPNRRAVQVTSDLSSFWSKHYPKLRRQLMRRYPKHAWPDDPKHSSPPPQRSKSKRKS